MRLKPTMVVPRCQVALLGRQCQHPAGHLRHPDTPYHENDTLTCVGTGIAWVSEGTSTPDGPLIASKLVRRRAPSTWRVRAVGDDAPPVDSQPVIRIADLDAGTITAGHLPGTATISQGAS